MTLIGAVAGASLSSACVADSTGPPAIRYGETPCARCGMTILDARFVGALRKADGTTLRFDDIGCLAAAVQRGAERPTAIFVHDYFDQRWLDAWRARFVKTTKLETPMASGLAAFASSETAAAFARTHGGTILSWDELIANAGRAPEPRRHNP